MLIHFICGMQKPARGNGEQRKTHLLRACFCISSTKLIQYCYNLFLARS